MKLVYCDKCGFYEEVKAILFDKCPKCNTPLIIDDEEAEFKIFSEGLISKLNNINKEFTIVRNTKIEHIKFKREKEHKKFEKMGKISDEEVTDFLIDLWG